MQQIINSYDMLVEEFGEEAAEANFRDSAIRLLRAYFKTGAFENPYTDTAEAQALIDDSGITNGFNEANQKGIVS